MNPIRISSYRRMLRLCALIIAETIVLSLCMFGQTPQAAQAYGGRTPGSVVAFYYPWYDQRDPKVWNRGLMSSLPNPLYDSRDANALRGHMDKARSAGIDAFAVTWNGSTGDWADRFKTMLTSASGGFKLTIHYETTLADTSVNATINNLRYIRDNYMSSLNYLRYEGKPVLFFWRSDAVGDIGVWQNIRNQVDPNHEQLWSTDAIDTAPLSVFDGIHLFSAAKWDNNPVAKDQQFRNDVNNYQARTGQRRYWLAGVTPGYDDRKLRSPGEFRDREGGAYYQRSWQAAIRSTPDLITISTWNEWYEGSSIESGELWGNQYVDMTRQYAQQYKGTLKMFGESSIMKVWSRTDLLVDNGAVSRTWLWGPENFAMYREPYNEGPGGSRLVYYFDKSRMEITRPTTDSNAQWFVTNGLLVREMMRGKIQVGDDPNAEQNKGAANIPVAGDFQNNPNSPTFASMAGVASLAADKRVDNKNGQLALSTMAANGQVGENAGFTQYNVRYNAYVNETGHNIASPFWDFFQQGGPIWENAGVTNANVLDWVFAMGFPISEAYWTTIKVGGKDMKVLVQAFERRIMTFTPDNPDGFKVEMGNVGRQYHLWRYGK
ncbi:endo-1,3-alpha-glucanase family glycosylhydrolase [Candidatus Chlorohelix sp.]|uniref:endo-1,3-alpha-glucanase family glycosylhydrolase n=1 Tax=Candidatus Chlorohelix sp. TaxID=3139201 RepID=UPI00304AEF5C